MNDAWDQTKFGFTLIGRSQYNFIITIEICAFQWKVYQSLHFVLFLTTSRYGNPYNTKEHTGVRTPNHHNKPKDIYRMSYRRAPITSFLPP